ncbi:MAG: IS3 family transposase [Pelagibacterales bacterium]|nr:IS3 family transposase [Pelagibacterales bacterium]
MKYRRYKQEEKMEIIKIVEGSELGVKPTLKELNIHTSTFYKWYGRYHENGFDGLATKERKRSRFWNKIPDKQIDKTVKVALERPELSPRELAAYITDEMGYFISESSVYRTLKRRGLITTPTHIVMAAGKKFKDQPSRVHQQWQTDFTYFKIKNYGWYYLSTIMDDYSRYIVSWELCERMKTEDVKRSIDTAIYNADLEGKQLPRLLSDNGSCYISNELSTYLSDIGMGHVRGKPNHPQTQGKIERYHRSMKNIVKLHHYCSPSELEKAINEWVEYYNNERYHESLSNVTPSDVYFEREEKTHQKRKETKLKTIQKRRQEYLQQKLKSA